MNKIVLKKIGTGKSNIDRKSATKFWHGMFVEEEAKFKGKQ